MGPCTGHGGRPVDTSSWPRSTLGHKRQAAMAELSGSQPSGPTQSSTFNPGGPLPPQEGDLAARNTEEKLVWVMHRRGGNTEKKGLTMHYRCRYCGVDFCGAGPQNCGCRPEGTAASPKPVAACGCRPEGTAASPKPVAAR